MNSMFRCLSHIHTFHIPPAEHSKDLSSSSSHYQSKALLIPVYVYVTARLSHQFVLHVLHSLHQWHYVQRSVYHRNICSSSHIEWVTLYYCSRLISMFALEASDINVSWQGQCHDCTVWAGRKYSRYDIQRYTEYMKSFKCFKKEVARSYRCLIWKSNIWAIKCSSGYFKQPLKIEYFCIFILLFQSCCVV